MRGPLRRHTGEKSEFLARWLFRGWNVGTQLQRRRFNLAPAADKGYHRAYQRYYGNLLGCHDRTSTFGPRHLALSRRVETLAKPMWLRWARNSIRTMQKCHG